jgi:hypothetical protein
MVVLSMIATVSLAGTTIFYTAAKPTVQGAAYGLMSQYMGQFQKAGFAKVSSIGNLATYRLALSDVKIEINKKLKAVAVYDPVKNKLILSADPRTVAPANRYAWGETIWHEVTHKIEDNNGDIGLFDNADYAERNIDYMTHIARSMAMLERLEAKAKAGASQADLKKIWDAFVKQLNIAKNLPSPKRYPPDLNKLQKWFGFKVNEADIRKFYANGGGGAALKKLFTPAPAPKPAVGAWQGTWDTNWGTMVVTQSGTSVTGTYTHDSGKITGTVSGNKLTGTWSESPSYSAPNDAGDISFTLSADGKSFTGSWRYGSSGSWSGGWNGTKTK